MKMPHCFRTITCAAMVFLTQLAFGTVRAETFPLKPVRIVVGAPPGGPLDTLTRGVAPKVGETLGQPVVVENRAGAAGVIATDFVAKSPSDGYTVLMAFSTHVTNPFLVAKLPYDTLQDFSSVSLIGFTSMMLVVNPSVPANSLGDLIALAKSRPGKLEFASGGTGNMAHMSGELLKYMAGIDMVHVPYKGDAPAFTDVIGGHIPLMFNTVLTSLAQVKAGKVRALAVTGRQRSPLAPDLPTMIENGFPGFVVTPWYGVVVPARTPKEVITVLNREFVKAAQSPELKARFLQQGVELVGSSPEELDAHLRAELARWGKVIRAAGIRAE